MQDKIIHEGRNVKRFREMLGIKQDVLAIELGLSQQAVSALEQKEALDRDMLDRIAAVLKVPAEAIKSFDEKKAVNIISNSTFENCNQPAIINYNPTFNPFEKVVVLYEELLKVEREKTHYWKGCSKKNNCHHIC